MALLFIFEELEILTPYGKLTIVKDGDRYKRISYFNLTGGITETVVDESVVGDLLKSYSNSYRILR